MFIITTIAAHLFDVVALRLALSTPQDELELSLCFLGFLHHKVLLDFVCILFAFSALLLDFFHVKALICNLFKVAVHGLPAVLQHKDFVDSFKELELLSDKDYTLISKRAFDSLIEDDVGHVCVDSR